MEKNTYFPVLDKGYVGIIDWMGSDAAIEEAARTSYGVGTRTTNQTRGLLRYLMRHKHTSPFEMCELKFHMAMPIFCARQILRHRTASVNEYSGRYSIMMDTAYIPEQNVISQQSKENNQGRELTSPQSFEIKKPVLQYLFEETNLSAYSIYKKLLEDDTAREIARNVLPVSFYTKLYWKIDLHNLFHFLTLRVDKHTQYETRCYANVIAGIVRELFPLSFEAWADYGLNVVPLSVQERMLLGELLKPKDISDEEWENIEKNTITNQRELEEWRVKLNMIHTHNLTVIPQLPSPISNVEASKRMMNGI